jgi:hypothetical protein
MIPYNIELQLEGDTDRIGNYKSIHYEFPFPEDPIIKARELEADRFRRIQLSFSAHGKRLLLNNNNKKGD